MTVLATLSNPFTSLSDLKPGDQKVTLKNQVGKTTVGAGTNDVCRNLWFSMIAYLSTSKSQAPRNPVFGADFGN